MDQIFEKYSLKKPENLIPLLQEIQETKGYLTDEIVEKVSAHLNIPNNRIYGVATFYSHFALEPKGKFVIRLCDGTACHVKGAPQIVAAFERELGVKQGETTPDGKFTLEAVACLGCCSLAPVAKIGEEIYGNLQTKDVPRILKQERA